MSSTPPSDGPASSRPVEIVHLPGATLIQLRGVIDEHFNRPAFVAGLTGARGPVIVDVGGVPRLTSFGVREFMTALREAPLTERFFVRCRPSIVAQFNSIPQFGGRSQIVTLYCPYVCLDCDEDFEVLVDVRDGPPASPPATKCPACRSDAEFDDIEESYFAYVASRPSARLPQVVETLIDGDYAAGRSFRVDKAIVGDLTVLWLYGEIGGRARLRRHAEGLEGIALVVVSEVTLVDDEGVSRLAQLLNRPEVDLWIARVPLPVARAMAMAGSGFGQARVVSVLLRTNCRRCGSQVDVELREPKLPKELGYCPTCDADVDMETFSVDDALLATLPFLRPPTEVTKYLETHAAFVSEPGLGGVHNAADRTPHGHAEGTARLVAGSRLGKYEIERRIGVGGMAEIFLGRRVGPEGFEKELVIKKIHPQLAAQERFVEMFLQEARIAARLSHPHIVQIYDLGRDGVDYFIAMEHVRGMDLNAIIKLAIRLEVELPIEICCRIVADIAGALEAAHSWVGDNGVVQPVLHRDVSPHNVLVSVDGIAKLTDFGIAKAADSVTASNSDFLKGKIIYMAPETVLGQAIDHRIDVFAAGLMLYVCLTQHHPFHLRNAGESLRAVLEAPIRPLRELRSEIPDALCAIVSRAIERDPAERTPASGTLQQELEEFLAGYGKPAGGPTLGQWLKEFIASGLEVGKVTPDDVPTPTETLAL